MLFLLDKSWCSGIVSIKGPVLHSRGVRIEESELVCSFAFFTTEHSLNEYTAVAEVDFY